MMRYLSGLLLLVALPALADTKRVTWDNARKNTNNSTIPATKKPKAKKKSWAC